MTKFVIFSDSKSLLESISSQDSNNPLINDTLEVIYKLNKKNKTIEFCWIPSHVGIHGNEEADKAAKLALNNDISVNFVVPHSDKLPLIRQYVNSCWQTEWDKNSHQKLYEIMPLVGEFNVSSLKRKDQVLIHRLRIGHTRLTHAFRMENRPNPPECVFCYEQLTVKHIMIFCGEFSLIRRRFYNVQTMNTVSLRTIIAYVCYLAYPVSNFSG